MPYTQTRTRRRVTDGTFTNRNGGSVRQIYDRSYTGTRTGDRVLGWKNLVSSGRQAGSAYFSDQYSDPELIPGTCIMEYWNQFGPPTKFRSTFEGVHDPIDTLNHLVWDTSKMEASALSKVYSKIRSQRSSVNGMNFVGELRETIRMLRRPAEALLTQVDRYFLSLENKKKEVLRLPLYKRRAAWEKAVAGSVLEWNFGWAPLISDSKAIADALGRAVTKAPKRARIVSRGHEERGSLTVDKDFTGPASSYFLWQRNTLTHTTREVQYIVGMEYRETCASASVNGLCEVLGFTPENFIPTIYELTPWSWLLDYFSNVGDILEASTTDTSEVKWIVKTVRAKTQAERSCVVARPNQNEYLGNFGFSLASVSGGMGTSKLVRTTVNRGLPDTLGIPGLVLSHPGESFVKMANMLSVLTQRRRGLQDLSYMPTYRSY